VTDATGFALRRDADLGYLGEWNPAGEPVQILSPVDARYHWPLWVGKRWRSEYAARRPGVAVQLLDVAYRVEAQERIEVPGGSFEALRIARVATLRAGEDVYLERTSYCWYAPAVGFEVRQVVDGTALDLMEWTVPPQ